MEEVPESLHSAQDLVDSINDKLDQKKPEIPPKYFVTVSRRQGFGGCIFLDVLCDLQDVWRSELAMKLGRMISMQFVELAK